MKIVTLLDEVTATGAGAAVAAMSAKKTFQARGQTSAGVGAATIKVEGTNVHNPVSATDWVTLGTINLTLGTARTTDGFASDATWRLVRANLTVISGTGAAVTVETKQEA